MKNASSPEEYIRSTGPWEEALWLLKEVFLSAGLEETVKWGGPVYTFRGKNIVGMAAFKSYAGIWFYQGALLADEGHKLINAQEGVTKALRQWRFGSTGEISRDRELIVRYIAEAILNESAGLTIRPEKKSTIDIPVEMENALASDDFLKSRFEELPLTKRRDFAEYIQSAKQEKTRLDRINKIIPMILDGKGLNDKYKK